MKITATTAAPAETIATYPPIFPTDPTYRREDARAQEDATVARALEILAERMAPQLAVSESTPLNSARAMREYLTLAMAELEHEEFHVLFFCTQLRLIKHYHHSSGTLDSASVYRREIVKQALACNAGNVVLAHNHPSGHSNPSDADKRITRHIQEALDFVDIRTLDHIIVAGPRPDNAFSFADAGLL